MRRLPLADRLRVRTPCDVGWDAMEDLGTHRHCARCDLTVHDVSAMTRAEVETLLEARERGERVCLHLVVRQSDRAVLVADGYVERPLRTPPSRMIAAAVATATAMTACSPPAPVGPHADIAVAPVVVAPIETASAPVETPTPPPIEPPPPPLPVPPREPVAVAPPVTPVKPHVQPHTPSHAPKKISSPAKTSAPVKPPPPQHDMIDGGAW